MSVIREQVFRGLAVFQEQPIRNHYPRVNLFPLDRCGHLSVTNAIGLFIGRDSAAWWGLDGCTNDIRFSVGSRHYE
jgi:hypothetical protein